MYWNDSEVLSGTCHNFGDFLGNGGLAGAVELEAQIGDHIVCVLGRGVHGAAAGSLLGSTALAQSAVEDASQVFRNNGVKDLLDRKSVV